MRIRCLPHWCLNWRPLRPRPIWILNPILRRPTIAHTFLPTITHRGQHLEVVVTHEDGSAAANFVKVELGDLAGDGVAVAVGVAGDAEYVEVSVEVLVDAGGGRAFGTIETLCGAVLGGCLLGKEGGRWDTYCLDETATRSRGSRCGDCKDE